MNLKRYFLSLAAALAVAFSFNQALAGSGSVNPVFIQSGAGSRTFLDKARDVVNVKDFGVVGDGITDITVQLQKAVDSVPHGGILHIPSGWYRLTDEIVLHAGITIEGEGAADFRDGAPPTYSSIPSYLFQETSNKGIFLINGAQHGIRISNLALAPALIPSHTPEATGKHGIRLRGSYPNFMWNFVVERVLFYNLEYGISVIDPYSGTQVAPHTYDWSVAPVSIRDSVFMYTKNGIYVDTNNADGWHIERDFFAVPSHGNGVYLRRFGYMHFDTIFGGGETINNNRLVNIEGAGAGAVDKLLFTSCQAETLTQFIYLQPGGGYSPATHFTIECNNCIAELGADVHLGNEVHFISKNSRWTSTIYIASKDVRVSSEHDDFEGVGDYSFLTGDPYAVFVNLIHGPKPAPSHHRYSFLNGKLFQDSGTTLTTSGVANTMFTLPATAALYEVFAYLPNASSGSVYMASARIGVDGGTVAKIGGEAGANISITVSGADVQVNQTSGVNQAVNWAYQRVAGAL